MLLTLPWQLPGDLPWQVFTSPVQQWSHLPSFVVGEYLFIACALVCLLHALRQGRAHILCWEAAIIAGTANDMIFMALPLVDNFWQAQATIMLTPRLPLYIPCVYVCFMYLPTVAVWRLGLPALPRATLSGLAAILFYAPYDIIGAKFLWWTWHDSDPAISNRLLGVPLGSTMWVMTFVATFAFLIGRVVDRDPKVSGKSFGKGLAMVAGLTTVLMVIQLSSLRPLDGAVPGLRGFLFLCAVYGFISLRGLRKVRPPAAGAADRPMASLVFVYFASLAIIMASFDPATHQNTSLHQTYGPCHVRAVDVAGLVRYKYLCAEDFDEDFSFACVPQLPAAEAGWYTVCGRAHTNFPLWMAAVGLLGLVGSLMYAYLFGLLPSPPPRWLAPPHRSP